MLWLIIGEASYEIISSNIHHLEDDNIHQLWVTRPGGRVSRLWNQKTQKSYMNIRMRLTQL